MGVEGDEGPVREGPAQGLREQLTAALVAAVAAGEVLDRADAVLVRAQEQADE